MTKQGTINFEHHTNVYRSAILSARVLCWCLQEIASWLLQLLAVAQP